MKGIRVMGVRQKRHHRVFPPPCYRCGSTIEEGDEYMPHRSNTHTDPYCMKCEGEMYI